MSQESLTTVSPREPALKFYGRVYDRLYRWGYHADPGYSHAKGLCEHLVSRYSFESVLDVGCALGWAVAFFRRQGKRAAGVDVSRIAVRRARELGLDVQVGSATALPFADRSFDLLMSTDCFEHLRPQDAEPAVAEMCRVARSYLALKINSKLDQSGWRYLAGQHLHLCLLPLDDWIERFLAHGGRLLDRTDDAFVIDRTTV